jgi:tRNA threonylcarbamoyladenosine biosynthesis protein TsaE
MTHLIELSSASPSDTLAIGRRVAALLRAGDVLLLAGRLGSGKTLFASGVAEGLGVQETVTSPTFVLAKRYEGFIPIVHADAYRLGTTAEFDDLELASEGRDGVVMIEWGNAVAQGVPADHLVVELLIIDEQSRRITLIPHGAWVDRGLEELTA